MWICIAFLNRDSVGHRCGCVLLFLTGIQWDTCGCVLLFLTGIQWDTDVGVYVGLIGMIGRSLLFIYFFLFD